MSEMAIAWIFEHEGERAYGAAAGLICEHCHKPSKCHGSGCGATRVPRIEAAVVGDSPLRRGVLGSEPERVLKLRRDLAVLRPKPEVAAILLNPSLVESKEEVIARLECPSDTTLPTQISRPVVELNQIGKRQPWRGGETHIRRHDSCGEMTLRQPRERLIGAQADG